MDMARALLKSMKVPGRYWAEAIKHAIYLLNRLPTKVLGDKTPHEAWTGRKPSLGHLKVFGCTAHAKVVTPHLKKLDRSRKLVYFGVEDGSKAYRLYDPASNKIVSRDTMFEESKVWDWDGEVFVDFIVDGESSSDYFDSGGASSEVWWQSEQMQHGNDAVPEDSENVLDELQWPADQEMQKDTFAEFSRASFSTPQQEHSRSEMLTPSLVNESGAMRFRNLDDIYDDTSEVELVDSDVEALLVEADEPTSYAEAAAHQEWKDAMDKEMQSIERNNTWELVKLPVGKKPIGLKWVFKLKRNSNGEVVKSRPD
jgi:hypothetical protein